MGVLEYWQVFDGPESNLFKPLDTTPADGTHPLAITNLARKYGLRAEMRSRMGIQDLRTALRDGMTVIVDIQAWPEKPVTDWKNNWEDGHYVVLVGMDEHFAYFMDPSAHGAYAYLPLAELLDRWHDYENRGGVVERFEGLGILIHGAEPREDFPGELIRIQ
jgi:ABC-type bacteriocin/lantibiotic exporter with double-glycine peptidase domain